MNARTLLARLGGRADETSPKELDPMVGPAGDRLVRAMDQRVLVTLRPISGMLAVLFVVFFVYNAIDLPPPLRELTVVYDTALVAISAALFQLLVQRRFPVRFAHPAAAMLTLAVVGNILMVMSGMRDGLYTVYIDIVVIGAGSTMLSVRALAAVLATVWLAWLPVAVHTIDDPRTLGIFAFTLFASTSLSSAILVGRIRSERSLHALREGEHRRTRELEEALGRAEEARAELNDEVAARTRELEEASDALQRQIEACRVLEAQLGDRQRLEMVEDLAGGVAQELWLPRAIPVRGGEASDGPDERHQGSGTILMVEDDATVRRVGQRILQRLGYEVLSAANGHEALELAAHHSVDLLWTDVLMPGMSGVELVKRARSQCPGLPVLLSSGYTGRTLSHEDLPDGCHFLSKPYSTKELGSTVAGILRPPG